VLVRAPCAGAVSMSVSYAGEVSVGFLVDAGLVPDPGDLVRLLDDAFAAPAGATNPLDGERGLTSVAGFPQSASATPTDGATLKR